MARPSTVLLGTALVGTAPIETAQLVGTALAQLGEEAARLTDLIPMGTFGSPRQ